MGSDILRSPIGLDRRSSNRIGSECGSIIPPRWSLRARMRHQLGPVVKFTHVTFYQPAVDELSASVVDSNTALAVSMTAAWSLTASWRERFDSEARDRGARSNHDGQVLFGVRLSTP